MKADFKKVKKEITIFLEYAWFHGPHVAKLKYKKKKKQKSRTGNTRSRNTGRITKTELRN